MAGSPVLGLVVPRCSQVVKIVENWPNQGWEGTRISATEAHARIQSPFSWIRTLPKALQTYASSIAGEGPLTAMRYME